MWGMGGELPSLGSGGSVTTKAPPGRTPRGTGTSTAPPPRRSSTTPSPGPQPSGHTASVTSGGGPRRLAGIVAVSPPSSQSMVSPFPGRSATGGSTATFARRTPHGVGPELWARGKKVKFTGLTQNSQVDPAV
jgi:hypothetical protein